jgi:hypothetical protein
MLYETIILILSSIIVLLTIITLNLKANIKKLINMCTDSQKNYDLKFLSFNVYLLNTINTTFKHKYIHCSETEYKDDRDKRILKAEGFGDCATIVSNAIELYKKN